MRRIGLEFAALHMKVDHLPAEGDGGRAVGGRRHHARAEHALVEAQALGEVAHGQHDVIEAIDDEATAHSAGAAAPSAARLAPSRGRNRPVGTMTAASAASTTKSQAKSPVRSKMNATSGSPTELTPSDRTNFAPNAVARQRPGV